MNNLRSNTSPKASFSKLNKTFLTHANINFINTIGESSIVLSNEDKENLLLNKIIFTQSVISRSLLARLSLIGLIIIGGFFI